MNKKYNISIPVSTYVTYYNIEASSEEEAKTKFMENIINGDNEYLSDTMGDYWEENLNKETWEVELDITNE